MKRILTLGIVLLTANSLLPAQEITFSETKFDWGTVQEQDGTVSHDFRFVNTGDVSVSAILSCRPFFILIFLPYIKMNHYGFSRKSIWKNLETFP